MYVNVYVCLNRDKIIFIISLKFLNIGKFKIRKILNNKKFKIHNFGTK